MKKLLISILCVSLSVIFLMRLKLSADESGHDSMLDPNKYLIFKVFNALPNVPEITEDPNEQTFVSSGLCYGCHQAYHLLDPSDPNNNLWREAGAAPVYGDRVNLFETKKEDRRNHHPMGTQARLKGSLFQRAPGAEATEHLNKNNEITCISCHADLHGIIDGKDYNQSKGNNFLRWDFTNDNADFCIKCHSDKTMGNNQIVYDGKHFWNTDSPVTRKVFDPNAPAHNYEKSVSCKQCMFCHFIHDGEERDKEGIPDSIRADIDALMRIGPENLAWGDRSNDTDPNDYEDMCYGCHGAQTIVGQVGSGSLLYPDAYFTHRFCVDPNFIGEGFPVSDGSDPEVPDDYGTQKGHIYCGTCHDVHDNRTSPYLGNHPSPYQENGLCEACHDKDGQFVSNSHPIGVGPNPDPNQGAPTKAEFVDFYNGREPLFSQGGGGNPGGITFPYDPNTGESTQGERGKVICLTCHNIHAAATSWQGKTKADTNRDHGYLLVKDNMRQRNNISPGSELCKACHPFGKTEYSFPEDDHGVGSLSDWGICNACHTPHNATGPKLWSRKYYSKGPFKGIRQLCFTCHNNSGDTIDSSGYETVFKGAKLGGQIPENYLEDHVMHEAASITAINPVPGLIIPIDPNDEDSFPLLEKYRKGGKFYCGSCHNPHNQPTKGGSYLRSADGDAGGKGLRITFCDDCHLGAHRGSAGECLKCHSIHAGAVLLSENETEARWILIKRVKRAQFFALPNVQSLSEDPNDRKKTDSPFCYGCHGPTGSENWLEAGAKTIHGDDSSTGPKEHHPMGNQATKDSPRASVPTGKYYYNDAEELTCKSCHDDIHGPGPFADVPEMEKKAKNARDNYYLRWELNNAQQKDRETFCLACHTDKSGANLSGKHLVSVSNSPNGRGGCMFCHFIHDGEERQSNLNLIPNKGIRADVDALMRQPAIPLIWKVQAICADDTCLNIIDNDPYDYEDMCYGCHGDPNIVIGTGLAGSLLQTDAYFTHRYTCAPDPNSPTSNKIEPGGVYPLSDGLDLKTKNDYGTKTGRIFCGTCHNVHDGSITPYLNHAEGDNNMAVDNGFCEVCHDENGDGPGDFLQMSHPVNVGPKSPVTVSSWNTLYYQGGNGKPFGITGEGGDAQGTLICLTCHNVHACTTSYDGMVQGKDDNTHGFLLIKDNKSTLEGSDMCRDCHLF